LKVKIGRQNEKWLRVESSAIRAVRYHSITRQLDLRFADGDEYRYDHVPRSKFRALLGAESIGAFVNREIKPHHTCIQIMSARRFGALKRDPVQMNSTRL